MRDQYVYDLKAFREQIDSAKSPEIAANMRRFIAEMEETNDDRTLSREERRLKRKNIYENYLEIALGKPIEVALFESEDPQPEVGSVYEVLDHLKGIKDYESNLGRCERIISSGQLEPELEDEMSLFIETCKEVNNNPDLEDKQSYLPEKKELAFMSYVDFAIEFYLQRASRSSLNKYQPANSNPKTDDEEKAGFLQWLKEHDFINDETERMLRPVIRTAADIADAEARWAIFKEFQAAREEIDADNSISLAEKERRQKAAGDRADRKYDVLNAPKLDPSKPEDLFEIRLKEWQQKSRGNEIDFLCAYPDTLNLLSEEELENLRITMAHKVEREGGRGTADLQFIEAIKSEYRDRGNHLAKGLFDLTSLFIKGRNYVNDEELGRKQLVLKLIETNQKQRKTKPRNDGADLDARINATIRARNEREKELRRIGATEEEVRYELNVFNEKIRKLQEQKHRYL